MNYLGYKEEDLKKLGAIYTAKEISGQPKLWHDTWELIKGQQGELQFFLDGVFSHVNLEVILTGAGSSAFVGKAMEGIFQKNTGKSVRAIATTDLVTYPEYYFHSSKPTLLVSFARSGNSPESVAVVNLSNDLFQNVYHLIITCNKEGELAKIPDGNNSYVLLLPPESNDQSLAMTGSFSSMLLAGILVSNQFKNIAYLNAQVNTLCVYGERALSDSITEIKKVARLPFERAVFLGSGCLLGIAEESQLKLQELTDGKVICKHDSFLGFRHGPKAVIDKSTLLVYLFSNNQYVEKYEQDLVASIHKGERGIGQISISEISHRKYKFSLDLEFSNQLGLLEEELLGICSVLPGQLLGFFKSLELGIRPDSPSVSNTITRTVEGVVIYPYTRKLSAI